MESEKTPAKKSDSSTSARRESPAPLFAPSRDFPLRRLQRSLGNDAVASMLQFAGVQAKLAVNQPGDSYEKEADRVAELFMSMRSLGSVRRSPLLLQRKCSAYSAGARCPKCEEEEEKEKLRIQRKPASSTTRNDSVPDDFLSNLGSGHELDPMLRESMESRFGHDFGGVRIHTGSRATQSARAINALAYTRGRDIVFSEGQFAPQTPAGLRLLAHELTHVVQQGAEKRASPPAIQRKEPDRPQKGSSRVNLVTISCADKIIRFSTDAASYSYELTSCDLTEGDYQANVSVSGKRVDFDLGTASPEGTRFHFGFHVEPFQLNPATLFQGQTTVPLHATNSSLQLESKSEDLPTPQVSGQLETPLEHFKRLVRDAAKIRLEANRAALEEWRTFLQQKMTPQQVRTQAQAQEILEVMVPAVHGHSGEMGALESWLQTAGPNQRWVLRQQIEGRYRACTGCHAMVRAHDMDRMLEERFGPYQTPLQQEREASQNAPAPVPDFAKKQAGVPQWAQVNPPAFPAVSETVANLEAIRPFFQVLGSKGYRVLPDEVLGSTASPREILEQINQYIDKRQADYLELERKIDSPGFDYLELRPIIQEFLPAAEPSVRTAVEAEIAAAEVRETVKEIFVDAAMIASLLLIVFPPTTALGMLGATALGAGTAAYQVYSGIESFEQGQMYALSRGTKDVFDPAQQEAADMLMTMGVLNAVVGGISLGTSAISGVKIIRSGGLTPGGGLGALQSVEAQAGEDSVQITGLDTPDPQARITKPNGEVVYEGPAKKLAGAPGTGETEAEQFANAPKGTGEKGTPPPTQEGEVAADQPKAIQKILRRNAPVTDREQFELLKRDIQNYRSKDIVPGRVDVPAAPRLPGEPAVPGEAVRGGTVAVARTNIEGLEDVPFPGASPEALPPGFRGKPGTSGGTLLKPVNPVAAEHAEQVALENARNAIEGAAKARGIGTAELTKGKTLRMLVEQEPCPSCASGIESLANSGVIKQFSEMYPELTIEIADLRTSGRLLIKGGKPL